jgi:hypothetical protein
MSEQPTNLEWCVTGRDQLHHVQVYERFPSEAEAEERLAMLLADNSSYTYTRTATEPFAPMPPRGMSSICRRFYLGGMTACVVLSFLFPIWKGRGYMPAHGTSDRQWSNSGVFSLEGGFEVLSFHTIAPIWSPPYPSGGFHASVRWPWQKPSANHHVNIVPGAFPAIWSAGLILFGFALRLAYWRAPPASGETLFWMAWSIALGLFISWLMMLAVGFLSMGYIFGLPGFFVGMLTLGVLIGLVRGWWMIRRYRGRVSSTS